jgi:TatD DNase family protein
MLIDSHSHIYFSPLDTRKDEILMNMREYSVSHAIQIGCNPESNIFALELAKKYPHLPATVGIHPTDGQTYTAEDILREINTLDRIISENRQYIV